MRYYTGSDIIYRTWMPFTLDAVIVASLAAACVSEKWAFLTFIVVLASFLILNKCLSWRLPWARRAAIKLVFASFVGWAFLGVLLGGFVSAYANEPGPGETNTALDVLLTIASVAVVLFIGLCVNVGMIRFLRSDDVKKSFEHVAG